MKEVKTKTHVQIKTENSFLADFAQKHVKGNFFMIKRNDNRWELNQREKVRELESRSVQVNIKDEILPALNFYKREMTDYGKNYKSESMQM